MVMICWDSWVVNNVMNPCHVCWDEGPYRSPWHTHSLSSSNVFTEYRGEVGSAWSTSTWFLFFTRERRISLFSRDCSARSTFSPSSTQPPYSAFPGTMLPAQVETPPESMNAPWHVGGQIKSDDFFFFWERRKQLINKLPFMSPNFLRVNGTFSTFFEKSNCSEKIQLIALLANEVSMLHTVIARLANERCTS